MIFTPKPIHKVGSFNSIDIHKIVLEDTTIYFNNDIEFKVEIPKYIKGADLDKELQREFSIMWSNFVKTRSGHDGQRIKKKLMSLLE